MRGMAGRERTCQMGKKIAGSSQDFLLTELTQTRITHLIIAAGLQLMNKLIIAGTLCF